MELQPLSVGDGIDLARKFKSSYFKDTPAAQLSDREFAKAYSEEFPTDPRLQNLASANRLDYSTAKITQAVDAFGDSVGGSAERAVENLVGEGTLSRIVGQGVGGLARFAPTMVASSGLRALGGASYLPRILSYALPMGMEYQHEQNRTQDTTAALANAAAVGLGQGLGDLVGSRVVQGATSALRNPILTRAGINVAAGTGVDLGANLFAHTGTDADANLGSRISENFNRMLENPVETLAVSGLTNLAFGLYGAAAETSSQAARVKAANVEATPKIDFENTVSTKQTLSDLGFPDFSTDKVYEVPFAEVTKVRNKLDQTRKSSLKNKNLTMDERVRVEELYETQMDALRDLTGQIMSDGPSDLLVQKIKSLTTTQDLTTLNSLVNTPRTLSFSDYVTKDLPRVVSEPLLKFLQPSLEGADYRVQFRQSDGALEITDSIGHPIATIDRNILNPETPQGMVAKVTSLTNAIIRDSLVEQQLNNPELYKQAVQGYEQLASNDRQALLTELDTLSGGSLAQHSPDFIARAVADSDGSPDSFISSAAQVVMVNALKQPKSGVVARAVDSLPAPLARSLRKTLSNMFYAMDGSDASSRFKELAILNKTNLPQVAKLLGKDLVNSFQKDFRDYTLLDKLDNYGVDRLDNSITRAQARITLRKPQAGEELAGEVKFIKDALNDPSAYSPISKQIRENVLANLQFVQEFPEARAAWDTLHRYKASSVMKDNEAMMLLGQDDTNSLTPTVAVDRMKATMERLTTKEFAQKMGKIGVDMQKLREAAKVSGQEVTYPTIESLSTDYGLSDVDADHALRVLKFGDKISQKSVAVTKEKIGTAMATRLFRLFDGMLPKEQSQQAGQLFVNLAEQQGNLALQLYRAKNITQDKGLIASLKSRQGETLVGYEALIRRVLQQNPQLATRLPANLINDRIVRTAESMHLLGEAYGAELAVQTEQGKLVGYMPLVRRGEYAVAANLGGELYFAGHPTKAEAQSDMQRLTDMGASDVKFINKQDAAKQFEYLTVGQVENLRQSMLETLADVKEKMRLSQDSPEGKAQVADLFEELESAYRAPDTELAKIIGVKGDPYSQKRKFVEGYNPMDLVPNLFDFAHFRTRKDSRDLTRMQFKLDLSDPFYAAQPAVKNRMTALADYVLGPQYDGVWTKMKSFFTVRAMVGSMRQFVSNSFQILTNGVPYLMHRGESAASAGQLLTEASSLGLQYLRKGTTGDKVLDSMMLQLKKDGVTEPSILMSYMPDTKLYTDIMSKISWRYEDADSLSGVVDKTKKKSKYVYRQMQDIIAGTFGATEIAGRNMTAIAGYLSGKKQGLTDPADLYRYTKQLVEDVNFVGDKSNRSPLVAKAAAVSPRLGAIVDIPFTLKNFMLNHLGQLAVLYRGGHLGNVDAATGLRSNSPEVLARNKKAFYSSLATLAALTGAVGMPFMGDIDELWADLIGGGESLSEQMRRKALSKFSELGVDDHVAETVVDTMSNGIPYGAFGIDASQNLGLGDGWGWDRNSDFVSNAVSPLIGVPGQAISRVGQAWEGLRAGDFESAAGDAVAPLTPEFIKQFTRNFELAEFGRRKSNSGNFLASRELTNWELLGEAVGYSSKATNETMSAQKVSADIQARTRKFIRSRGKEIIQEIQSGNPDKAYDLTEKLRREVNAQGVKFSGEPFQFTMQDMEAMLISMMRDEVQNGSMKAPSAPMQNALLERLYQLHYQPVFESGERNVNAEMSVREALLSEATLPGYQRAVKNANKKSRNAVLRDSLVAGGIPPALADAIVNKRESEYLDRVSAND